ncbi:protein phosphatase 2CA [Artemisia annua]|uniref:protein-serine/threonine phosphatase n=1 Tax=Artemisia annua TaxID=35608 RepID=A0A2U1QNC0_ARTAN|nr:protein phosphatase 2CA [Artemisia annua]
MAGACIGVVGETETPSTVESSSGRHARRRRMEIQQLKFLSPAATTDVVAPPLENRKKRRKVETIENIEILPVIETVRNIKNDDARFGVTTVCGRRRDMEDAVAVKPLFCNDSHFYGVYDGHGCSHVAMKCKERMHEIVKDEVEKNNESLEWKEVLKTSFSRMDKEVTELSEADSSWNCRCELQTPQCDAVGSTAVVSVVTPDKIVVSNCGDSRAVLCRNGVAIPLSSDHKPDRPDELARIEEAGGRVIYWTGLEFSAC